MKKLLTEPLVHFFLIGALLFALYAWLNRDAAGEPGEIVVTTAIQGQLEATFQQTWQRPPTEDERQALIDGWVREEILYQQGVAIGFDRGDPVIRRRVAQKMTFVADGLAPEAPSDEALEVWLAARPDAYELPPRYSFEQVYINPAKHSGDLTAYLNGIRDALRDGTGAEGLGDSIMLPGKVASATPRDMERSFGLEFAAAVTGLETGTWQGPVGSGYGLHFVYLTEITPGRMPGLAEVRSEVERDFLDEQAADISESFYQELRDGYTVRIEQRSSDG